MKKTETTCLVIMMVLGTCLASEDQTCVSSSLNIAKDLCHRLFPLRILNPLDVKCPNQVKNSTCFYTLQYGSLTISGYYTCNLTFTTVNTCQHVPLNNSMYDAFNMAVQNTAIEKLEKNAFVSWSGIQILQINMNDKLRRIEPGAFENLTNVWNISISDNPKLGPLEHNTFQGLINLRELRYLRNNVKTLSSITVALSPSVLPNVKVLDFTGNHITRIEKDDFKSMENSSLDRLILSLTKTQWIDRRAFDPLNTLVNLVLSRNNLNCTVLTKLVNHLIKSDMNLTHLSVEQNILHLDPKALLDAVAQNGSHVFSLNLKENHLGILSPGFFPKMSNLIFLDLTDVMIDDVPDGVISYSLMPKLQQLFLGKNIFSGITSSMVTKTLTTLSIPLNDNDLPWNTFFNIDPQVFLEMPLLELLDLSSNRLNVLRNTTLTAAKALKVLLLHKTFLNEIEEGAFLNNNNIFYLDLSSNIFPVMNPFTKEIFKGLYNLIALDLSDCHISHINNYDVFLYLNKLQYLSLRMNSIYYLSPRIFENMPHLGIIDLRYNILISWTRSIFQNNKYLNQTLLDYNHIETITEAMLNDFMLSKAVKLYGNSINCDCNLMNTVRLTLQNVDAYHLLFTDEMNMCANEQNTTLSDYLSLVNSALCINTQLVTIIPVTIGLLIFVSLTVYVIYYYYKYDIHFCWLKVKRKLGLLHYIGGSKRLVNAQDFKYDAFVSYCTEDEKFVEKMVYILEETNCSRFKLCVFERDFKVGDVLTDKILECIECSRRTILVLTDAFAKSQWCCWEMYIAQNHCISPHSEPNDTLILIKKSDIPESLMTPTLSYLMKTRVYLEWHDSPIRQKIFWEQLISSLRPDG